ncbi:MAG: bifunctional DNA-formamidopyrimidine glycosylase/DNA-(apurinic or apyrimidinic site) lyase [Alphaproteobacteria bacterium]|nr:bifunctional DNA-formamidopyrimidine glycosylase/DNA-(apurinic or apyrimidinic site) lyase [Alphaproteobacteria bacterium]
MPELPEVETVRAGLAAKLTGGRLETVELLRKDLRVPFPKDFAKRLAGRRLESVGRRGKYLLWTFDDRTVLIAHLGMSGRMVLRQGAPARPARQKPTAAAPPPAEKHEHVVFHFADGTSVAFSDPRRFGLMTLTTTAEAATHPLLAEMGPEPLGPSFTGEYLRAAFKGRRAPLKSVLIDQRLVAGLGNIYVCEALFHARLSPWREAGSLRGKQAQALAGAVKEVLAAAIAAGGSSLRDYVQASGELGYFQDNWSVYGREGKPCPACKLTARCRIARVTQGGRSTFYCERQQR